jgi:hypothetical protein
MAAVVAMQTRPPRTSDARGLDTSAIAASNQAPLIDAIALTSAAMASVRPRNASAAASCVTVCVTVSMMTAVTATVSMANQNTGSVGAMPLSDWMAPAVNAVVTNATQPADRIRAASTPPQIAPMAKAVESWP